METQSKVLRAQWVHQDLTECKALQDPRGIMAYRGHLVLQVQMDLMDLKVFLATMDRKALKGTQESVEQRDPKALLGKNIWACASTGRSLIKQQVDHTLVRLLPWRKPA